MLHDVDLDVKPGERLAIVGPSGAGKSTLGRLIAGINPPSAGHISIGGVEVSKIDEKRVHSYVALVTQENHVFVGTIAQNLRLAAPEARVERLWDALDVVDAQWARDLPDGLETTVGSGALELPRSHPTISAGTNRFARSRYCYSRRSYLTVGSTAARSAERALARVLEGRTVISIAHRLYTAYDADRVCVMIDGKIAELGSHDELVALGGSMRRCGKPGNKTKTR